MSRVVVWLLDSGLWRTAYFSLAIACASSHTDITLGRGRHLQIVLNVGGRFCPLLRAAE
jgi:hypothetical protein